MEQYNVLTSKKTKIIIYGGIDALVVINKIAEINRKSLLDYPGLSFTVTIFDKNDTPHLLDRIHIGTSIDEYQKQLSVLSVGKHYPVMERLEIDIFNTLNTQTDYEIYFDIKEYSRGN